MTFSIPILSRDLRMGRQGLVQACAREGFWIDLGKRDAVVYTRVSYYPVPLNASARRLCAGQARKPFRLVLSDEKRFKGERKVLVGFQALV